MVSRRGGGLIKHRFLEEKGSSLEHDVWLSTVMEIVVICMKIIDVFSNVAVPTLVGRFS